MKRVAILVETALASGRSILGGISKYLHEHEEWSVFHPTGHIGSTELDGLEQWEGDGIIARISNHEVYQKVKKKNVPVVDVLGNEPRSDFPLVKCDDSAIGRLVAEHFVSLGHRSFAFFGLSNERYSLEREAAYFNSLKDWSKATYSMHIQQSAEDSNQWRDHLQQTTDWLAQLPKPIALMVASDQFGPIVMRACQRLGLSIPEQVSVAGVDNDQPFCDLCRPRLTSVEPDHTRVGYEAARLLDRVIAGKDCDTRKIETPPLTLHARQSSDSAAVSDPRLVKAMQAIRQQACLGITVDEVASSAGLSRSVLQRRFREHLGTTVGQLILDTKLQRAREMLTFTHLPLAEVAERSGFNYQEYLTYVFKKHLQTTPARYRDQTTLA